MIPDWSWMLGCYSLGSLVILFCRNADYAIQQKKYEAIEKENNDLRNALAQAVKSVENHARQLTIAVLGAIVEDMKETEKENK